MPIGDWIREANQRRREWWRIEDQATAYERWKLAAACEKARKGGYLQDFQEIYNLGYVDAKSKKPHRIPGSQPDQRS